ncbi:MAG: Holliday junction branch migration DNA helicase RuvB [Bacilli bacterium]|nr:Holliday junction branch migration DNA helicase RuvB [Bacilli bacterium]
MNNILDIKNSCDTTEISLRPYYLNDYIGQVELKAKLEVFIKAAKSRHETLDHVLLYGPPGLGKTSLALAIAHEMNVPIKIITATVIEKTGDLAAILSELEPGQVLFIDEIHRLPRIVEESLYSAMEDYRLDIVIAKDFNSKSISLDLPPFTLIGATTRAGMLSSPLRSRFGIIEKFNYYSINEIEQIVGHTAKFFNCEIDSQSMYEIALRSRGTPRIANRILRRVRDYANCVDSNKINIEITSKALEALKINKIGLDEVDISYLKAIINRFNKGPVGIETLASSIGEEVVNLEDVYEPYLLQIGFIDRTPKGRIITSKGYAHCRQNGYVN